MKVPPMRWTRRFSVNFGLSNEGLFFRIVLGFPVFLFSVYHHVPYLLDERKTEIGVAWIPLHPKEGYSAPGWSPINITHGRKQKSYGISNG